MTREAEGVQASARTAMWHGHMMRNTWLWLAVVLVLLPAMANRSFGQSTQDTPITGELEWPEQWVVFAPLERVDPVLEKEVRRTVPEAIEVPPTAELPAREFEGQTLSVEPGMPVDLSEVIGRSGQGNVAYVFVELNSPKAQAVTLGMGGDWWVQAWLNGEAIFDTLEEGNVHWPISITNHTVNVQLREGKNVLAVRYITGSASALLALGGPSEFATERRRLAEREEQRRLNIFPESFEERMHFPEDKQALVMAERGVMEFPDTDAELSEGGLAGLERMPARQLYLELHGDRKAELLDTMRRRFDEPVKLLLSKSRYPWEDRHLDVVAWMTPPDDLMSDGAYERLPGKLEVRLKDAQGGVLARHEIEDLSPTGLFFSVGFPEALRGSTASLEVVWHDGQDVVGAAESRFHVREPSDVARSGHIPLHVLNEPGATIDNAPMTVGVPFPRGALSDERNIRLVDGNGEELPLQTRVTARWSRFGPVKWLLCDFTASVDGEPREVYLEYGPNVERRQFEPLAVTVGEGAPAVEAGRLRVSDAGVSFDRSGEGDYESVLASSAMLGAFVRHEDGRRYAVPADVAHQIEELGSEKAVVRRTGWYVHESSGERFCQFVTRLVFHRDSPVVRVFHTWIFTGNGNEDRIRDMGWRFETAADLEPAGLLSSFENGEWLSSDALVQFDHSNFLLTGSETKRPGRAPGVLSALVGDTRVSFGAKDFWQNFPSELEFTEDAFTFYNWPRHNSPATYEQPVPHSEAFLHRFAHEGELLDFRVPQEYTEGSIWGDATRSGGEPHWAEGNPDSVNAQGIARTEEMFLYFSDRTDSADQAARVLKGLNDESLRAVVDPAWVADSGVYGDIHEQDTEKYAEDEHIYKQVVRAPARWNERLGFYGMWLHGDVPAWGINLHNQTATLYRAIRKHHHGWPVVWLPFARSGDPEMLKYAEAATRQILDANFCHYATAEVDEAVGEEHFRRQGFWDRSLLPWAGRNGPYLRNYTADMDHLWDAYYLTGYARARDVTRLFGELIQKDYRVQSGPRGTNSTMASYLDMYEATFDPWFLVATHEVARLHRELFEHDEVVDKNTTRAVSHFWRPADIYFHQFTGDEAHGRLALNHAISYTSPRAYVGGGLWPRLSLPLIVQAAYAHKQTGETFHLRRAAHYLDWARFGVYDGEIEYGRGSIEQGGTARGIFTGYYIRHFPYALGAFERAGHRPEPIPNPFFIQAAEIDGQDETYDFRLPEVILRKQGQNELSLMLSARGEADPEAYAYQIHGPSGAIHDTGAWPANRGRTRMIDLSADAPTGQYRVQLSGSVPWRGDSYAARSRTKRRQGWAAYPLAKPEVPEVMVLARSDDGIDTPSSAPEVQYWFRVPEDVSEFWIEFPGGGGDFGRVSVWNPNGERAWDRSISNESPGRVNITVPAEHAGKLWRATGASFVIDPRIPPYFSVSREKWFDPER